MNWKDKLTHDILNEFKWFLKGKQLIVMDSELNELDDKIKSFLILGANKKVIKILNRNIKKTSGITQTIIREVKEEVKSL